MNSEPVSIRMLMRPLKIATPIKALRQAPSACRSSDFGVALDWEAGVEVPFEPRNGCSKSFAFSQMSRAAARVESAAPRTWSLCCLVLADHTGGTFFLHIRHDDGIAQGRLVLSSTRRQFPRAYLFNNPALLTVRTSCVHQSY